MSYRLIRRLLAVGVPTSIVARFVGMSSKGFCKSVRFLNDTWVPELKKTKPRTKKGIRYIEERELYALLMAGIPADRAIRILRLQPGALKRVLENGKWRVAQCVRCDMPFVTDEKNSHICNRCRQKRMA